MILRALFGRDSRRFTERPFLAIHRNPDDRKTIAAWKRTYRKNQAAFERIHKLTKLTWGVPNYNGYLKKLRKRLVSLVNARKVSPRMAIAFYIDVFLSGT